MIYNVTIQAFDAQQGLLHFSMDTTDFCAATDISESEADGVLTVGETCPLEFKIIAQDQAQYLEAPEESFKKIEARKQGDLVCVKGIVSDYIEHDTLRLGGKYSMALQLQAPQQSTDYRQGSKISAQGTLKANLPSDDHDETGLRT